jgi:peptide chain release factor 1
VCGPDLTQLNNEPGCHKIQRVPPTERNGRVHTSAVTVAVVDPSKFKTTDYSTIDPKDLKVEWYSGTGCGGQNRNKVQTSCRLTHLSSGIVQTAQTRSRENSYQQALAAIKTVLDKDAKRQAFQQVSALKQGQMGNGSNSNLVRTYCFQHGLVKGVDGKSISIKQFEKGLIDLMWT